MTLDVKKSTASVVQTVVLQLQRVLQLQGVLLRCTCSTRLYTLISADIGGIGSTKPQSWTNRWRRYNLGSPDPYQLPTVSQYVPIYIMDVWACAPLYALFALCMRSVSLCADRALCMCDRGLNGIRRRGRKRLDNIARVSPEHDNIGLSNWLGVLWRVVLL